MGIKISDMTATGSAPAGAYFPIAYNGENYKITAGTIPGAIDFSGLTNYKDNSCSTIDGSSCGNQGLAVTNGAKAVWLYYRSEPLGWFERSTLYAYITHAGTDITTGWTSTNAIELQYGRGAGDTDHIEYSAYVLVPVITTPSAGRGFYLAASNQSVLSLRGWVY